MRFGIQMLGLNEVFLKDNEAFLKRIREAGYRYMEPCLILNENPQFLEKGWMPADFEVNQPLLEKYGVKMNSCLVFASEISSDLERLISLANKYGIRQIVLPCPAYETGEEYEYLAEGLKEAGKTLYKEGIELLLRNGRGTGAKEIDGTNAYEWLLHQCKESVGAQPDVGYLLQDGIDPEAFLWRNREQIRALCYKDMEQTADGLQETCLGSGMLDLKACFQFARAAEVIQLTAQESSKGDFLEDIASAAEQLMMLGQCRVRSKSILCVMDSVTGEVTRLHTFDRLIEAPNWLQADDDYLFYNSEGYIWKYQISTDTETRLESGQQKICLCHV